SLVSPSSSLATAIFKSLVLPKGSQAASTLNHVKSSGMRIRKSTRHDAMTLRRSFEKSFLMTERASRIISPLPRLLKLLKLRWCEVRWLGQTQIYAELGHPAEQFLRIVSATCGCSRRRSPTP